MNPMDNIRGHHRRRSLRLRGYDYSQAGAYFLTICTKNRVALFGEVVDGKMQLNECGQSVQACWLEIPAHFPNVALDAFVVMPNHVHGIVAVTVAGTVGANDYSPLQSPPPLSRPDTPSFQSPSRTIGSIVRGFKIGVTKWFRLHTSIFDVWQRNYYEHIIRDDGALDRIRQYITNNPQQWALDRENPKGKPAAVVEPWEV
jgi:putative transposase